MAEENQNKSHEYETKDRGVFDFLGKKKDGEEEKPSDQEVAISTEFEKVKVSEHEEGEKKHSLLEKLHRSDSSSSSSSDEEEGEGGEKKKKKKKGLKEKIGEEKHDHDDTTVPIEKAEVDPAIPEDKKGFLDKIKEKLPGQHKKTEDHVSAPPPPATDQYVATVVHEAEPKEKKGFLDKIKEKLPGYHPKTEEDKEKDKEKETGAHH